MGQNSRGFVLADNLRRGVCLTPSEISVLDAVSSEAAGRQSPPGGIGIFGQDLPADTEDRTGVEQAPTRSSHITVDDLVGACSTPVLSSVSAGKSCPNIPIPPGGDCRPAASEETASQRH